MLKNTKSIRAIIFLAAASLFIIPSVVLAQWSTGTPPAGLPNVELDVVLENIIVGILGLVGILSVLFLVYGGVQYLTSAGDENKMEGAKSTITYAILGLVIAFLSYAIITTVIKWF